MTRSHNDSICVWNTSTGLLVFPSLDCYDCSAAPVAFSEDGKYIIAVADGQKRVWAATTGKEVAVDSHEMTMGEAEPNEVEQGTYRLVVNEKGEGEKRETVIEDSDENETVLRLPTTFLDRNSNAPPSDAGVYRRLAEADGMMLLQNRADFMLLIHFPPFVHLVPD